MSDFYLFRTALADLMRPRKLLLAVAMILFPAGAALIYRMLARHDDYNYALAFSVVAQYVVFGFVLVILSLVFSTGIIVDELEQKTITYLLTRPIPRWRILLDKFAASMLVTAVTVCLSLVALALITFGAARLGQSPLGRDLFIAPVGALVYGALFLLFATLFRRPLIGGLMFAFVWEGLALVMPGQMARVSVLKYLQVLSPHQQVVEDTVNVRQAASLGAPVTNDISMRVAWIALISMIVLFLGAALVAFSTREYVPREDAA